MGQAGSKPEDVAAMAASLARDYEPPLGPPSEGNPLVYFDLQLGRYGKGTQIGRVVMELKKDIAPKTAENFLQLCLAAEGEGYKGSRFHRIIPSFMAQGGDFTNDNGTGGYSIYGSKFPDETFILTHAGPGILSMANSGPNTNGSQFFLCVAATPWLDGKHVVFGQVVEGYSVVKAIETLGSRSGETAQDVMIADCGVIPSATTACLSSEPARESRTVVKKSSKPAWTTRRFENCSQSGHGQFKIGKTTISIAPSYKRSSLTVTVAARQKAPAAFFWGVPISTRALLIG